MPRLITSVTAPARHAPPKSGTLRRPVADLSELAAPFEVQLDAQPFGPNAGTPFGAIRISNTVKVE